MNHRGLKRPLYVVGFSFALALLAASVMGYHAACVMALLGGVLFLVALAVRTLRAIEGIMAALLAAVLAFSLFVGWEYRTVQPFRKMDGQTLPLTLWIEEKVGDNGDAVSYFARVKEGALPQNTRLLVVTDNTADAPQLYERVTAEVTLTTTEDWRQYNVVLLTWIAECERTPSEERPCNYTFLQWRTYLIERMESRAGGDVADLLRAVCFGDKSGLSGRVRDGFAAAGLSHVTAVSGFHMNVISLLLFRLLRFLGLRKRWAALTSLPLPAVFAALTGCSPSAMRAGVMCTVMLVGALFRRTADARNSLGAALLVLLVFDPAGIYDLGLQLSAAATWGVLVVLPLQSQDKTAVWYKRAHAVQLTVAAVMATLPLSALYFGETSALAPLTNLVAQPLAAVAVGCGCFGTLLLSVPWLTFLGSPLLLVAGLACKGLLFVAEQAAKAPMAFLPLNLPYLVAWAFLAPFGLVLGWWLLKGRGVRIAAMMLVIALCLSTAVRHVGMRGVTTITACNTGSGTVVLLQRDGHHAAIVTSDVLTENALYTLERYGVDTLDFVCLVCENEAAYIDATTTRDFVPPTSDAWTAAAQTVTFWNNTTLELDDGWCRLTMGEHTVLIAPRAGDVSDLPTEYQTADMVIVDRVPPKGVKKLALSRAVLCCGEADLPRVTQKMIWGVYPVDIASDEAVTIQFR